MNLSLDLNPVPASRPRVTRWGVYYGKKYTEFRKDAVKVVSVLPESLPDITLPLLGQLEVSATFHVKKPKTSKLKHPRGDIDNYLKTLDILNGVVWKDDVQIVIIHGEKKWAKDQPSIELQIKEL